MSTCDENIECSEGRALQIFDSKLVAFETVFLVSPILKYFNQVFQQKTLVIKLMNVGGWVGGRPGGGCGRAVGRVSTIGFQSITPKPFETFE